MARVLVIAVVALASTSCSILMTQGPPANHAQLTYFHCKETSKASSSDLLMALATAPTIIGPVVFVFSALEGMKNARKCREAKWALSDAWTKFKAAQQRPDTSKPPTMHAAQSRHR